MLPIFSILSSVFRPANENWAHIREYMLWGYALPSLVLVVGAGVLTAALGTLLAWLVAAYEFPFRNMFRWALMLPLAVPPYIAAYTYSNMLSYTGIVQKTLRAWGFQPDQAWFRIMSMPGAIFIFTMFLYPYVYIIVKAFLERQSGGYVENARLLGRKGGFLFLRVVLPIARPAMAGGATLVAFEVLSDYGVVNYYGIQTFTTAIFKTWFGMYDIESATRLGAWFMLGIVGVVVLERTLRRRRRYSATTGRGNRLVPVRLAGARAWAATALCGAVLMAAFLVPVAQLLQWATWTYADVVGRADFWRMTGNTVYAALLATAIIMAISAVVANTARLMNNVWGFSIAKLATAGYSIPGAIVAIGVLSLFIGLDGWFAPVYSWLGWGEAPLILSLSLVMLVAAYVVRFMATGYNATEAGFEKVGRKYTEASRMLGAGPIRTFFAVDLPLIRGALLGGVILTFVEAVKELPLALLLRPFNFDTLATKAYQYAGDERIFSAAVPSLLIIGVSMISVVILHHIGKDVKS